MASTLSKTEFNNNGERKKQLKPGTATISHENLRTKIMNNNSGIQNAMKKVTPQAMKGLITNPFYQFSNMNQ